MKPRNFVNLFSGLFTVQSCNDVGNCTYDEIINLWNLILQYLDIFFSYVFKMRFDIFQSILTVGGIVDLSNSLTSFMMHIVSSFGKIKLEIIDNLIVEDQLLCWCPVSQHLFHFIISCS